MSNVKLFRLSTFECRTSNCFDVRHSCVESQNDTNVESQTDIRHSNVERQTVLTFDIRMSNIKLF